MGKAIRLYPGDITWSAWLAVTLIVHRLPPACNMEVVVPRTFVAVKVNLTPTLRTLLAQLGRFGPAVRPVAPQHLHITLRFLGQVHDSLLGPTSNAMGRATATTAPFAVLLDGLGVYPYRRRPTTVWVGTTDDTKLAGLVDRLTWELQAVGFAKPSRPWSSHVTVARVKAKPPKGFFDLLDSYRSHSFEAADVQAIDLMLSELHPTGPRYTRAASVPLRPSPRPAAGA